MAFCVNCGTKLEEQVKFCPQCGKGTDNGASATAETKAEPAVNENAAAENAAATAEGFDPKDIETNKAMGILAYIIFFIPLIAAKDSAFAKYHANQGFALFLGYLISSLLWIIPILGWIAAPICYLGITALSVMGIINAVNGQAKALPVVGKIKIIK